MRIIWYERYYENANDTAFGLVVGKALGVHAVDHLLLEFSELGGMDLLVYLAPRTSLVLLFRWPW